MQFGGAFIYALAAGVCAGVAAALLFGFGMVVAAALLCVSAALLLCAALWRSPKILFVAITFAALALGMLRADMYNRAVAQENLPSFAGRITAAGTVVNDPEQSGAYVHANIAVSQVNGTSARGTLLAFMQPQEKVFYGDHVVVAGTLQTPQAFMGDTGNEFDYPGYLRVQGVSMTLNKVKLQSRQPGGASLLSVLYGVKHAFDASVENIFPQPDAALFEGILLGQRHGLSQDITQAFVAAGLIHIVILSGYSMSVVSEGVLRGFKFLPRRWQLFLSALCMILFVLMTGAAATTLRACAMALVALVARYLHRTTIALRSLAVVATAMILWNPIILLHDVSFMVSVLATFGLIAFAPAIENSLRPLLHKHPEALSIVTSTIAVQIFALPTLLYFTGNVSLLSVPANLLVLPLLPFVIGLGFAAGTLNFISGVLAFLPAVVADALVRWILLVAYVVQAVPFSATTIFAFPLWLAVACYVPLTALAIYLLRKTALPLPTS